MARPRPVSGSVRLATAWRFVVLLGLACLVSPVLIVTHPPGDGVSQAAVILGGAVMLFVLALLRIISLLPGSAAPCAVSTCCAPRPDRWSGRPTAAGSATPP